MNTHLQLLWLSLSAPRAALDLARQHPDPYRLGWIYAAGLAVATLLLDLAARAVFPDNYTLTADAPSGLAWLESPWTMGAVTALLYAVCYVFLRWFWRKMTAQSVSQSIIDAAIAVSFACSIVMMLPQQLAFEVTANAAPLLQAVAWLLPMAVVLLVTSVAFAAACEMDFARALGLNFLSSVILLVVFVVIMLLFFLLWAGLTDASLEQIFGSSAGVQP